MATKITDSRVTTDQTISQATSPDPSKIWRPVRPVSVADPTSDQISQLRGQIAKLTDSLSQLNLTVQDNASSSPTSTVNAPAQVTGVSASVTAKNINGVLTAVIDVSFTPGLNFSSAQLWATNYNGNGSPQLLTQGFSSPIEYAAQITGELVTLTVVAVNSAGVTADFASAPSATALLNGASTTPPAPSISQGLTALSGSTGWQFAFNTINGLLSDVIAGYWVYRSSTHTTPTSTSARFQWIPQPPTTLPYTFQDITGSTFYYWVSAVNTSGLESALTDTTATNVTVSDYPTAYSPGTGTAFSNPTYAYDGNVGTAASISISGPSGTGGSTSGGEQWDTFSAAPTGVTITGITLEVSSAANVNERGVAELQYSLDSGSTWSDLYNLNTTSGGSGASTPKQYYTATLLTTQDLTHVQVKATVAAVTYLPTGGDPHDPADWVQGSVAQSVYEVRITVTYH